MSIRMDILNAINEGITNSNEIIEKFEINPRSFHNSVRFLTKQKWILAQYHPSLNLITHYEITPLGHEKIAKNLIDKPAKNHPKKSPDFHRMRAHMNANTKVNNTQLVSLWNEQTDYYLPYEGDENLRPLLD